MAIQFTESALTDLDAIWRYYARRDVADATRIAAQLDKVFGMLEAFPQAGRERADLRRDIRMYVFRRYVILYSESVEGILVEAVIRGERDIEGIFGEPD